MAVKKLKILEITSTFAPLHGGMERVVAELSQELAGRGHEVTVLTTNLYAPQAKTGESRLGRVRLVRLPNKLFLAGYGFAPAIITWLSRHWREFDVVHCHGYNRFATEFALFFLKGKLPAVFTAHGFYHTGKRKLLKKLHEHSLGSKAALSADACVAITEDDAKVFERMGVPRGKIIEIPNGVEVERFARALHGKNSFAKYKPFVLFVGRIHESKGLQYLLPALQPLDCNLVIVGKDAGFEKRLREIVYELGMQERVFFFGQAGERELVEAYKACELLALPSEWEAFGLVIVEAMAAGKPVVGSDRAAIPKIISDGESGFVVPYASVKKLREKIFLLLEDTRLGRRMGASGRKAAENYSWKLIAAKTEGVYLRLLKSRENE